MITTEQREGMTTGISFALENVSVDVESSRHFLCSNGGLWLTADASQWKNIFSQRYLYQWLLVWSSGIS